MKTFSLFALLSIFLLSSCSSIRVAADYDRQANFDGIKSFAFFKPGIDKADISDLDKKRILRAIESNLITKGMSKSQSPDILISIFTKTEQNVNVYQSNFGFGYGWGWHPWYWNNGFNTVTRTTEGTLYIDLIDASKKELIWQGMGSAALPRNIEHKQERINEIVNAILEKFPPETLK